VATVATEESERRQLETEVDIARGNAAGIEEFGKPSIFTCPECHGTLLRLHGDRPIRYRCHTGHAFTADTLLAELNEALGEAIWNAVRSIQEGAMLLSLLADRYEPVECNAGGELSKQGRDRTATRRCDPESHQRG
jgi:two-component system, chemotaxis family, protein-glutamate methylesterase/glutaminase